MTELNKIVDNSADGMKAGYTSGPLEGLSLMKPVQHRKTDNVIRKGIVGHGLDKVLQIALSPL